MGHAIGITRQYDTVALRKLARRERDGRVASRLLAIASVLDGVSRTDAARQAGMERQTLRDWVHRFNADGVAGLRNRAQGRPPLRLTAAQEAEVRARVLERFMWLKWLLTRYAPLTFLIMCVSVAVLGLSSLNLLSILSANLSFIAEHGIIALREGGLKQFLELCGYGIISMLAYIIFKACERELVDRLLR